MKISSSFHRLASLMLGLCLLLLACDKDQEGSSNPPDGHDTIFPLPYFPAYPGSWWKYVDNHFDTTTRSTAPEYKPDSYEVPISAFQSDTFLVPFYENIPIWGYEAHTGPISHAGSYPLTTILSDSLLVGSSWTVMYWSGTQIRRQILATDTSLLVNGQTFFPCIVVQEYYSSGPPLPLRISNRYYAFNVGLVREEIFNLYDSLELTRNLIQYHINH